MVRRGLLVLFVIAFTLGFFAIGLAIAAPAPQLATFPIVVTVLKSANVRSGPGTDYAVVSAEQAGQRLNVLGCNFDCSWYQLANDCWIAAFLVQPETPAVPPTPSSNLPLPQVVLTITVQPPPVVSGSLPLPAVVLSIPVVISNTFIQTTHCPQTAIPTATYSGPGVFYPVVEIIPTGQCIIATGRNTVGDWLQLTHGGWIEVAALLYPDPVELLPVVDRLFTATPEPTATPLPTSTPVPTPTVNLAEILNISEWQGASQDRKTATATIWTLRFTESGAIADTTDPIAYAAELQQCVENTLAGTADILGPAYPVQQVANGCISVLAP